LGQEARSLRLLVTGGQGFLGGALVRALVSLGFAHVAATARREAPELAALGVKVIRADLCQPEQARAVAQDRDVIFHTAAKAGVWGAEAAYQGINIDATRFLLEGARAHAVRYFIHTSSPSVTFQGSASENESETAPYGFRPLNAYCKTKIISEREVLREDGALKTMALRPHLIYGPGDPHLLPRVFEASQAGRLVRVGDGSNMVDVTHVRDAVAAQLCALVHRKRPEIWGQAYFVTSGVPIRLWSWLAHILQWQNLPQVRRSISLKKAVFIGKTLERIYRKLEKASEPPLTEFSALQLGCTHTYSIEKARRLLGYRPAVHPYASFEEQFDPTVEDWACFRGLL
jgi:2-alkyl-3-oxoalkanoate reductase